MSQIKHSSRYIITVDTGTIFGRSAILDNYADTLYFIKILTPLGQKLLEQTFNSEPLTIQKITDEAIEKLKISLQAHFPKNFLGNFHSQNPEDLITRLSNGTEYIDLPEFFRHEEDTTIDDANWHKILKDFIGMLSHKTVYEAMYHQGDYKGFNYKLPPLRTGDKAVFSAMYLSVMDIKAFDKTQLDYVLPARALMPEKLDISHIPLEILSCSTFAMTYVPQQPDLQQIYAFEARIVWQELAQAQKDLLYLHLGWHQLRLEKPLAAILVGYFIPKDGHLYSIETIDGRNYEKPKELSFKPFIEGLEVLVRMHDGSDISCLTAVKEAPNTTKKRKGSDNFAEIYTILPFPEYLRHIQWKGPKINLDNNKTQTEYSALLRLGFLPNGDLVVLHQDRAVKSYFLEEKQQWVFEVFLDFQVFNETGRGLNIDYNVKAVI